MLHETKEEKNLRERAPGGWRENESPINISAIEEGEKRKKNG